MYCAWKHSLLFFFFLLLSAHAYAQLEANKWFVPIETGLDFSCGTGRPFKTLAKYQTNFQNPNCSSICDSLGNLLFYSDGVNVFDRNNQMMPGGNKALIKDTNYAVDNSMFIVPNPARSHVYFIFFIRYVNRSLGAGALNYAVVDLEKNNGLGEVVSVKYNIEYPAFVSNTSYTGGGYNNLNAIRAKDRKSYWLLFDRFSYSTSVSDSLIVYHITGDSWTRAHYPLPDWRGKPANCISADGKRLAIMERSGTDTNKLYLYNFNKESGNPGNSLTLPVPENNEYMEFSPDGTKLYVFTFLKADWFVWQYDVSSGLDSAAIMKSRVIIAHQGFDGRNEMKCGPDFKKYYPKKQEKPSSINIS